MTYTDSYSYLGVPIGRGIDVNMVYEDALCKFESRLRGHLHLRGLLSMSARVRMANVYFIPIFSYLNRFFLMSEVTAGRVSRLLRLWLIRGKCTSLQRLAAPAHAAGLANPMRDLGKANVASLLRHKGPIPSPQLSGAYSLLISDHVEHAAISFHAIVGDHFPPNSDQRLLMQRLVHCDPDPVNRLAGTLRKRFKRHGNPASSDDVVRNIMRNTARLPESLARQLRNHAFNLVHRCIYTNHRARRYGTATGCSFCNHDEETCHHLFVDCVVARNAIERIRASGDEAIRDSSKFLSCASVEDHRLETKNLTMNAIRSLLCFSLSS